MRKLLLFMLLSCMFLTNNAATYYVSNSGDDANPGTLALPWKHVQFALDAVVAGDTVFVRAGVYYENLVFNNSGNSTDGYIVLINYPNEDPVIDGNGAPGNDAISIEGKSYLLIQGFELRNWAGSPLLIWDYAHHLIFNDLDLHDFAFGVTVMGSGCHDVEFNRVVCRHFPGSYDTYGFDISYDTALNTPHHDFTFNNCEVHSDMNPTQNVDGFATGHWNATSIMYNFTYNHCVVYDVFDGWDVSARNTVLNGCLAYNCYNGSWKLWSDQITLVNCIGYFDPGTGHPVPGSIAELDEGWPEGQYHKKVTFQNCTLYGGEQGIHVYKPSLDTLVLRNSIVCNTSFVTLYFEDPLVLNPQYRGDYNILHSLDSTRIASVAGLNDYTFTDWKTFSGQDSHSKTTNNLAQVFVDTATFNLHLRDGSPAVDAGSPLGAPAVDYEGYPRPYGPAFDIGAYEKNPLSGTGAKLMSEPGLRIYPNPASSFALLVMPSQGDYLFKVIDLSGRTVKSGAINRSSLTHLDVCSLKPGIYLVSVVSLDGKISAGSKLIVAGQ